MVAVARAMMLSPRLLLLDEAFEGLAPVVVNRFTEAVLKIKALGVSILMANPTWPLLPASATASTPSTAARSSSRARRTTRWQTSGLCGRCGGEHSPRMHGAMRNASHPRPTDQHRSAEAPALADMGESCLDSIARCMEPRDAPTACAHIDDGGSAARADGAADMSNRSIPSYYPHNRDRGRRSSGGGRAARQGQTARVCR